jgi:hypothetical protein
MAREMNREVTATDARRLHRFIDRSRQPLNYRKDDMSCLAGRHLSDLVRQTSLTLDAGLVVVAICDDRSIGNLRVEARHPRERIQERNPVVLRSKTEASSR